MATTIGALAYKLDLDSKQFTTGMKLSRQELNLHKKLMQATVSPADKLEAALKQIDKVSKAAGWTTEQLAAAQREVRREFEKTEDAADDAADSIGSLNRKMKTGTVPAANGAKSSFAGLSGTLGMLSKGAPIVTAVVAGGRAIIDMYKTMASAVAAVGEGLANLAKRQQQRALIGMNEREFGGLQVAGAGLLDEDQIGQASKTIRRIISEAARGEGEGVNVLKEIGLDAQTLNGQGAFQQLMAIADAMRGVRNEGDRLRIASKLFGEENAIMAQILRGGSAELRNAADDAERFGMVLSGDMNNSIQEANQLMAQNGLRAEGLKNTLLAVASEGLYELNAAFGIFLDYATEFVKENGDELRTILKDIASGAKELAHAFGQVVKFAGWLMPEAKEQKPGFRDGVKGAAEKIHARNAADSKSAKEQLEEQKKTNQILREQKRKEALRQNALQVRVLGTI